MIQIPDSFQIQPFYQQKMVSLPDLKNSFKEICRTIPFYYDMVKDQKYWKNKHEIIPVLLEWWSEEEQTLTMLFRERNTKEARPVMIFMSAAFIDCLFWMNDKTLSGLTQLEQDLAHIKFKPINCEERLDFVLRHPSQYQSFTQLRALYLEVRKTYAKIKLLEHIT
ncbi:YpoC family protein [Halalkalibacter alkalisediminis]|uniref:YpoC family protein n=1 Tax=Halalkalibacter alkalisediminis TaxID=935616 RepID=A0ABV6NGN7_9BACI|nr:hypothetical protein [Halalkalibacter alkalisediminis]